MTTSKSADLTHPGGVTAAAPDADCSSDREQSGARKDRTSRKVPPVTDLARLEVLRARLEGVLADPETSPRDLAAVSREYRMVLAQLAERAPADESSALDEIAARRAQRGAS